MTSFKKKSGMRIAMNIAVKFVLLLAVAHCGSARAKDIEYLAGEDARTKAFNHEATQVFIQGQEFIPAIELTRQYLRAASDESETSLLKQFLATFYSFVGDYSEADSYYLRIASPENVTKHVQKGAKISFSDAPAMIAQMAAVRRAVFINENHGEPVTRVLPILLLPMLKAEGFTYLALETLNRKGGIDNGGCIDTTDVDLCRRGYPLDLVETGVYSHEPVYGELIRTAIKLGFHLVAYDEEASTDELRDREEAERLARLFAKHPGSKMLVVAGFDHVAKESTNMANVFRDLTGIDPLTIDQAALLGLSPKVWGRQVVFTDSRPKVALINGKIFSSRPGAIDVSVYRPPFNNDRLKSLWLTLDGARIRVPLSDKTCSDYPCLVSARLISEASNSVPSDRVLIESQQKSALYLRPGNYLLSIQTLAGTSYQPLAISGLRKYPEEALSK